MTVQLKVVLVDIRKCSVSTPNYAARQLTDQKRKVMGMLSSRMAPASREQQVGCLSLHICCKIGVFQAALEVLASEDLPCANRRIAYFVGLPEGKKTTRSCTR